MNVTLRNYTVFVNEAEGVSESADDLIPSSEDGRLRFEINGTSLPGVTLDGSYDLSIMACSHLACRLSSAVNFSEYNHAPMKFL